MTDIPAGIGHNSGDPIEMLRERIATGLTPLSARAKTLLDSCSRVSITDNDAVGRAGDLQAMLATVVERAQAVVEDEARDFHHGVAVSKRMFEEFAGPIDTARLKVRDQVSAFRQEQRAAAVKAQQEQRAAEKRLREAAAAVEHPTDVTMVPHQEEPITVALPAVRGDYGSRTGDRRVKVFVIADPRKLDLKVLNHPKVAEAIQQACRDLSKIQSKIKGVVVHQDHATTVRK